MSFYDDSFKILLLGDPEVDKSAMIWRNIYQRRTPNERLTIGVDFFVKTIIIDKKKYKLQLWDLAGAERHRFLLPTYCLGANAVVLLYDFTTPQTLNHLEELVNIIRQKSGDIPIMLVGIIPNEKWKRQVSIEKGKEIVKSRNLNGFMEINARTGENIGKAYETITRLILANEDYQPPIKKKKYEEFIVYDLKKKRDRKKLNIGQEELQRHLNPKSVLIIIRDDLRRIFIWKGSKSPVRKRFIASGVAQDLQRELMEDVSYHTCKIVSVTQGEEPQEFLNALILETMKVTERRRLSDEEIMVLDLESEEGIKLIKQYEEEAYKYAIWRGEVTQGFNKWLKGEKVKTMDARLLRERLEDQKSDPESLKEKLNDIEHFLKFRDFNQNLTLELLAQMFLLYYKKHNKEFENFLENIKKWESFDENKFPYSEILLLFYGDDEYREDFLKEIRKGRFEGGDKYPYPYVFKPPEPPEDLAVAPRTQLHASPRKKDREEEIYCQYCGRELTKEEQFTHSCKKKPEKNNI